MGLWLELSGRTKPQVQSPAAHESTAGIPVPGCRLDYQHCKMNLTELLTANTILGSEQKLRALSDLWNAFLQFTQWDFNILFVFTSVKLT